MRTIIPTSQSITGIKLENVYTQLGTPEPEITGSYWYLQYDHI